MRNNYNNGYGGGSNPFDSSIFNEVRPTYIGPPVEELVGAKDYLTTTARENMLAKGVLAEAFANSISEVNIDEEAVGMINEHKNKFSQSLTDITKDKNMAYAGPTIQRYVNDFVGDPRIAGRKKMVSEFEGYTNAIRNNPNVPVHIKKMQLDNLKYNDFVKADDENYLYQLDDIPLPYEKVDLNKNLLEAVKLKLDFPEITSQDSISFITPDGRKVNYYDPSFGIAVTYKNTGHTRTVLADELRTAMRGVIDNDEALKGYIVQEGVYNDYRNGTPGNPVTRVRDVFADDKASGQLIGDAVEKFAQAFAYRQQLSEKSLGDIRTRDNSDSNNPTEPNAPEQFSTNEKAYPIDNPTPNREAVKNINKAHDENINSMFGTDVNGNKVPKEDITIMETAALSGDVKTLYEYSKKHGLDVNDIPNMVAKAEMTKNAKDLANAKVSVASKDLLETQYKDLTVPIDRNNDFIKGLEKAGFSLDNYSGITDYEKLNNLVVDARQKSVINYTMPSSIGAVTTQTKTNKPLLALAEGAWNTYEKNIEESRKFGKVVDKILSNEAPARSGMFTTDIPVYSFTKDPSKVKKLEAAFTNWSDLEGVSIWAEDDNGNSHEIKQANNSKAAESMEYIVDNATDVKYTLSTRPINGNPHSWRVTYKYPASPDNKTLRTKTIHIPIGVESGGITSEFYEENVKGHPLIEANQLINDFKASNIKDKDFNFTNYPGLVMNRTDKGITYKGYNNGSWSNINNEEDFRNALANQIQNKKAIIANETFKTDISNRWGSTATTAINQIANEIPEINASNMQQIQESVISDIVGILQANSITDYDSYEIQALANLIIQSKLQ